MVSESVITAIMAASVTGAGLVIAFYALIARMWDKISANRLEQLDERRSKIKEVVSKPESFEDENFSRTTQRLDEWNKEINSIKTFPKYLGPGVILDFSFFTMAALVSFIWLTKISVSDIVIFAFFFLALLTFFIVGVYGIADVWQVMANDFRKLKEKKEVAKEEIKYAPQEAKIAGQVEKFLLSAGIPFGRDSMIKTNGDRAFADFLVNIKKTQYIIEVLTKPTSQNVYRASEKYEMYRVLGPAKTILIADFSNNKPAQEAAAAFWDYVVDIKNLGELQDIFRKPEKS